ncbi:MAG: hypothetical protein CMO01_10855 [Thalassobius sp.]|nr:hypothetical protein [Thalassovita sp.]
MINTPSENIYIWMFQIHHILGTNLGGKELPIIPYLMFILYIFIMLPVTLFPKKEEPEPEINLEDEVLRSLIEEEGFDSLDELTDTSSKVYRNQSNLYDAYITIIRKKKTQPKKRKVFRFL